jgi:hypothetical protein
LAFCVSNLSQRDPSQQEQLKMEKYKDEKERREFELRDMRHFFLWICETILLREKALSCSRGALLLLYSEKIRVFEADIWRKLCRTITVDIIEANVVDLVMALKAVATLRRDQR